MFDAKANGERLKTLRTKANETIAEAAENVGVSIASWSAYERGKKTPRDEVKVRISDHYATPISDIFFAD